MQLLLLLQPYQTEEFASCGFSFLCSPAQDLSISSVPEFGIYNAAVELTLPPTRRPQLCHRATGLLVFLSKTARARIFLVLIV